MNWRNVKLILAREVRDQLRDRRTLFMIAVLPLLLYPLLGMSLFQILQFRRDHATRVLVVGEPELPGLPALLEKNRFARDLFPERDPAARDLLEVTSAESQGPIEARREMQEGGYDVVVYFPRDFGDRLQAFRQRLMADRSSGADPPADKEVPPINIYSNKAQEKSEIAHRRVFEVLEHWRELVGRQNLLDSQLPATAARPFELEVVDLAGQDQQKAVIWAKMLPFVLFLWALTGAFYPAVDLCAGEKERGTLETLLSSPAQRSEIVWGKLLTIILFSIATAVLNMASLGITGSMVMSQIPNLGPPPLAALGWLLVALVPMAALFSALCLALAAFARSTKEGQYYLMPLVLVTMPLTILPMSPGVELNFGNALIPITGMVLLLRTVLEGEYAQALPYVPIAAGVTLLCCLLAIRWAADQFNTESVLFRESERWDINLWFKHLLRDRDETPSVSEAVFCGVLILIIRFFMSFALRAPGSFRDFAVLAITTELVVIATPALMMTVMLTRSPAKTLLLRMPPLLAVPAAAVLAIVMHPLVHGLADLVKKLYPISETLQKQLEQMVGKPDNVWLALLAIAIVPAICEELAFRGFILSGLRHLGHKWRAIAVSSLFFGITHAIFQQSIVACLLGAVIGYLAVQTGSLLPGIAFHMLNNTLAVVGSDLFARVDRGGRWLHWFVENSEKGLVFHTPMLIASALVSAAVLLWFRRLPYARSAEESLQEAIEQQSAQAVPG